MSKIEDLELKLAKFPAKERERLGDEGKALPQEDGPPSFPIRNEQDLKNAIQAFGRAKDEDKPRLKRFIKKRARELDLEDLIPDDWDDEEDGDVAASATDSLVEDMVLLSYLDDEDRELIAEVSEENHIIRLGRLERVPGKNNWIEHVGGLPKYIEKIAVSLHEKRGFTISRAIATAINKVKKWARGGEGVNPDTVAKAAAALASWESKKARSKARKLGKAVS